MFEEILDIIWDEHFWLPIEFSWDDFKKTDIVRPQLSDLYIIPLISIFFLIIRFAFERFIAVPICKVLRIIKVKSEASKLCEELFLKTTQHPSDILMSEISVQTGWSIQKCSRWFNKRRKQSTKASLVKKSKESCWRCFVYICFFAYGSYILIPTGWIWDIKLCFVGFIKHQELPLEFKWYYILETSFYTSLLCSQFTDTKRKDFVQLFVHHILTITLLSGSYIIGHFRIGSIIVWLHDAADYWLEAAKVANYAKHQRVCDTLFVVFALTFLLTRWIYFPVWVLYTWMRYNTELAGHLRSFFTAPYILLGACFVLFGLHLFWGYLIGKMVYKFRAAGKVEKDDRSDDEQSNLESDDGDKNLVMINNSTNKTD
ncbi:ceramide synthase 6 [Hydra vulgaris]|uniref:Ceramide synthase 6 n=1 Tax=Hydra vulgaris TaxID=6087 RepID=A0ABM4BI43_HYDVU